MKRAAKIIGLILPGLAVDFEAAEHFPPIEGLSNPPDPAPEDLYPPPDKDRRKWYLDISDGWVDLLPEVEDLSGHVSLDLDERGIVVDDLEVEGEDLEMLGRLASSKGKLRGQLYIHYKLLHLGIGLEGGDKSIHLSKPKQWFLAQPELDDTISLDASLDRPQ